MTDLTKHGLEPAAWLYTSPYDDDPEVSVRRYSQDYVETCDLDETPLYRVDQVAEVVERLEAMEDTIRVAAKWFEVAALNHEIAAEGVGHPENAPYVEAARRDTYRAGVLRAAIEGKKP